MHHTYNIKAGPPLLLLIILFTGCLGQSTENKKIHNKDFNWTISIPNKFETVSAADWAKMQNKGASAIENTYGQEVVNQAKTIFVFKSGQFNYFESNYQPFDESVDGDFLETWASVNEILYETFISQMQGIKIDTTRTIERVDNLDFQTFKMKITYPNSMVMHFIMYSRLFDKREFTVNIMYVDESKGQLMKESWLSSKFKK